MKPLARLRSEYKQIMGWSSILSHDSPNSIHGYEDVEVYQIYVACSMDL